MQEPLLSGTMSQSEPTSEGPRSNTHSFGAPNGSNTESARRWGVLRAAVAFSHNTMDVGEGYLITDNVEATLLQCFRMLDFWLLSFAVSACTGISLAFINNASSLVRSLGGDGTMTVRHHHSLPTDRPPQKHAISTCCWPMTCW